MGGRIVEQLAPQGIERVGAFTERGQPFDVAARAGLGAQMGVEGRAQVVAVAVAAAQGVELLHEVVGVGAAVGGLDLRRLFADGCPGRVLGQEFFEHLTRLRAHRMLGEVVAALEFAR